MSKYLVETYYTCSFKVKHYLDDITEEDNEEKIIVDENDKEF